MPEDIVRVLRIIEYVGPRSAVEKQVAMSIHGQRSYSCGRAGEYELSNPMTVDRITNKVTIRAATLGQYPEILDAACVIQKLTTQPSSPSSNLVKCGGMGCETNECEHWGGGIRHRLGDPCMKGRTV